MPMNDQDSSCRAPAAAKPPGLVQRLRLWWRSRESDELYLAEAADLADLERRMRALERERGGPAFMTFNH